jgi:ATP-dependent RNA helicase RhlE
LSSFEELGISTALVQVLKTAGITIPTEIQQETIPHVIAGRNVLASAETGSGKTAAFLLPIIEMLGRPSRKTEPRALVLAPTRELALQIGVNASTFARTSGLRSAALVGGESLPKQQAALRAGADIAIATPGRLNDLLERRAVSLSAIQIVVLDEADRMLDMGFLPQVRRVMRHIPRKKTVANGRGSSLQTLLLSATLSREVELLAHEMMDHPVRIEIGRPASTVAGLRQSAYSVMSHAKAPLLLRLLSQHSDGSFLIFTETKRGADRIAHILAANRHSVETIHSDKSQSQRNRALAGFKSGRVRVLVATDVAARGIDVDDISHVVNYDVPLTPEAYLHRVGRTARAGKEGSALTLVSPEEESSLALIEHTTGLTIERSTVSGFSDGRTEQQARLASELGRLRTNSRSFGARRVSR